jgi:hypothetical protein
MGFGVSEEQCPLYIWISCSNCEQETGLLKYTPPHGESIKEIKDNINSDGDEVVSQDLYLHQHPSENLGSIMVEYRLKIMKNKPNKIGRSFRKKTVVINYSIYNYEKNEDILGHSQDCHLC